MKKFWQITFLIFTALILGIMARAQFLPDPISLIATPGSPSSGETFRVTAATPSFDKNTAEFFWTVDGKSRDDLSGQGRNSITLEAGVVGSSIRVEVTVTRAGGLGGNASLIIRPADLSLTWFAETLVPKWYKGKALPSQNSVVNIVAVPQVVLGGRAVSVENLIYRWDLDDQDSVLTGVGEQVFRIKTSDLPRSSNHVRVTVEDAARQIRKEGELFIVPANPRAVIYPSTPLGGIEFRRAAAIFSTAKRGLLDFVVESFFFPAASRRALTYQWSVAGSDIEGAPENPHILTLDTERQPSRTIPISVTVDDADPLIAGASKIMTLFLQ